MPIREAPKDSVQPHQKLYQCKDVIPMGDVRYPIFTQRYQVVVPAQQLRSIAHIRFFGTPASGDPRTDRMVAEELRHAMLTINDMVELHKQGARIGLAKGKDSEKIYTAISTYLEMWKEKIAKSINQSHIPVEDLLAMDAFAGKIYHSAKYHFDDAFISRHLSSIRGLGARGILNVIQEKSDQQKADDKVALEKKNGIRVLTPLRARPKLGQVDLDDVEINEDDTSGQPERASMAQYLKPGAVKIVGMNEPQPEQPTSRGPATSRQLENMLGRNKGKAV